MSYYYPNQMNPYGVPPTQGYPTTGGVNPYAAAAAYGYGMPMQPAMTGYMPSAMPTTAPTTTTDASGQSNTLWMGDIEPWMDETYLYNLYAHTGEIANVKLMRNKNPTTPGASITAGYAFVYFTSPAAATRILETFNNQPIPGLPGKHFRLNWATFSGKSRTTPGAGPTGGPQGGMGVAPGGAKPGTSSDSLAIFVGDLATDVNDQQLLAHFQYYYPSSYAAKVVMDHNTNMSKGFGFVYFRDENERSRALVEMQGYQLSYRPIKVNVASKKSVPGMPSSSGVAPSSMGGQPSYGNPMMSHQQQQPAYSIPSAGSDPTNTTVFVGGIDTTITSDILRSSFQHFGEIANVKVPTGKGYGFVEFANHETAERVLRELPNGAVIGNCTVRLSWGKPSGNVPVVGNPGLSNSGNTNYNNNVPQQYNNNSNNNNNNHSAHEQPSQQQQQSQAPAAYYLTTNTEYNEEEEEGYNPNNPSGEDAEPYEPASLSEPQESQQTTTTTTTTATTPVKTKRELEEEEDKNNDDPKSSEQEEENVKTVKKQRTGSTKEEEEKEQESTENQEESSTKNNNSDGSGSLEKDAQDDTSKPSEKDESSSSESKHEENGEDNQ